MSKQKKIISTVVPDINNNPPNARADSLCTTVWNYPFVKGNNIQILYSKYIQQTTVRVHGQI